MAMSETRVPVWIHRSLVPLFFLTLCPPAIFIFWYTATHLDGSFKTFWDTVLQNGFFSTLGSFAVPLFFGTSTAWKILACFAFFQLVLMRFVPGKPFVGPVTPKGNIPIYKANGMACFLITFTTYLLGTNYFHWF